MKNKLITFFFSLFLFNGFSQNLYYGVSGVYEKGLRKTALSDAKLLRDFIPGYPVNWIEDYVSVELQVTENGKTASATGKNEVLTARQKELLLNSNLNANVTIRVKYNISNAITHLVELNEINLRFTIVPETEAEFIGGYQKMMHYLEEKAISKIPETVSKEMREIKVNFTVNENGEIINTKVTTSGGNPTLDQLFLKAIIEMPKWKPAVHLNGKKVKQDFQFTVAQGGC